MCTRSRRRARGSSVIEFALALFVLFFVLFPLINLIMFACACASLQLFALQTANIAAVSSNFNTALNSMDNEAKKFANMGLAKFVKLVPHNGHNKTGVDLYLLANNYRSSALSVYGPNTPIAQVIDQSTYVYEASTQVTCDVYPFLSLASMPFISDVPIVGKSARMTFTAQRAIENPDGFEGPGILASIANSTAKSIPLTNAAPVAGYNYPGPVNYVTIVPGENGGSYVFTLSTSLASSGYIFFSLGGQYVAQTDQSSLSLTDAFAWAGQQGQLTAQGANPGETIPFQSIDYVVGDPAHPLTTAGVLPQTLADATTAHLQEWGYTPAAQQAASQAMLNFGNWCLANDL